MRVETVRLDGSTPGTERSLRVVRFGTDGARPRCYVQAGIHADEIPPLLVAHHLRARLERLEAAGAIRGEIVLVPAANPIGLGQQVSGSHVGRFCLADGQNFNRGFPRLASGAATRLSRQLAAGEPVTDQAIRDALASELASTPSIGEHQALKHALLTLAVTADVVLDLHCDTEAVVHVYTGTPLLARGAVLARLLGAQAFLTADVSGEDPFDEACSRPWWELARLLPALGVRIGCFAATVELRGAADVDHATAITDAQALVDFMTIEGAIDGVAPVVPPARCEATPLAGSEPLIAACGGVVVYARAPGDLLRAGDVVAEVVDPVTGDVRTVETSTDGVLYARAASRWACPGMRLGKVAGRRATRVGNLLSP